MLDAVYVALAAAASGIGGVVGFGIQVRALEKARLEIEELKRKAKRSEQETDKLRLELQELVSRIELAKLTRDKAELEVEKLRKDSQPKSLIVTELTTDEVIRYADIQFSRREPDEPPQAPASVRTHYLRIAVIAATISAALATLLLNLPNITRLFEYVLKWLSARE